MARPIAELLPANVFACAIDISERSTGGMVPAFAWLRDDALRVVDEAQRAYVVILGGDVWKFDGDRIEPAYANWSVEHVGIKPSDEDVARSAEKSRCYITSYPRD